MAATLKLFALVVMQSIINQGLRRAPTINALRHKIILGIRSDTLNFCNAGIKPLLKIILYFISTYRNMYATR
jgi:hypothetical protein